MSHGRSAFTVSTARCEKFKKHAKDTSDSLCPITWLLKLFAINCNLDHETSSRKYLAKSLIIMTVLGTLNIFCLYLKITNIYKIINTSIVITDAGQCIYDQCQFMVDLWFVYTYGRHISVNYFKLYECIDNIIGMASCFLEIKRKLIRVVAIFITIWLISSVCDFVAWVYSFGYLIPTLYCASYIFFLIKITTTLDLTSHVMHIEFRLKLIADIVAYYYTKTELLQGELSKSMCFGNWLEDDFKESKSRAYFLKSVSDEDHSQGIKLLRRCYLLLTDQVEFINRIFGFRIILNSLSLLIDMIRFTNIGVRILIGSQKTLYYSGYLPVMANIIRHLTCAAVLLSLVYHTENAYREKDRILKIIDHLLIHKRPDEKLDAALTELRQLIQDRPITFNMSNFFTLNYGFLTSVASVYVTYTIILLQST